MSLPIDVWLKPVKMLALEARGQLTVAEFLLECRVGYEMIPGEDGRAMGMFANAQGAQVKVEHGDWLVYNPVAEELVVLSAEAYEAAFTANEPIVPPSEEEPNV